MGRSKSSSKREVYSNTIITQETRKTSNWQPNFTPKTTGKRTKKTPKISRRKEIIKNQAEINEKEMKETIVKINKKLFFLVCEDKQNWQHFSQTHQGKKIIEKNQINKIRNEKERLQQTMQKYKGL